MPTRTRRLRKVYRAAPRAPFKKSDAQAIGEEIERLERTGPITPERVVEKAAEEASPLHRYFTWDDSEAAQKQRLWEARHLVNHLIIVVDHGDEKMETKAFHSVRIVSDEPDVPDEQHYASMATVENSDAFRRQVIANAHKELNRWKARYKQYRELFDVVRAIDRENEDSYRGLRLRLVGYLEADGPQTLAQLSEREVEATVAELEVALEYRWFEFSGNKWHLTNQARVDRARDSAS